MIILPNKLLAIVTPPKSGSTSLHAKLCEQGAGIYVMGPQADGTCEKHTGIFPFMVTSDSRYVKIVMVRNPFSRARSLWLHYKKYGGTFDFDTWVRQVLIPGADPFNTTISQIVRRTKLDHYVKLEFADAAFKKEWGLDLNLPHLHKLNDGTKVTMDDETAALVRYWGHEDFDNYRYSRKIEDA